MQRVWNDVGRPHKKLGQKTLKKHFPECLSQALGEEALPREPHIGSRGRHMLPHVLCWGTRGRDYVPRVLVQGTRGRFLTYGSVQFRCEMHFFFFECPSSPSVALGEDGLPRVPTFPESPALSDTRGSLPSPSARVLALGEACDTRGILLLP
jgi:hypothetical protein